MNPDSLRDPVLALAREAANAIMAVYATPFETRAKADRSPVTEADEAAERLIVAGLKRLTPDLPVVAEEAVARGEGPASGGDVFWLVDPLDGTREFVSRNGEFTVNIALIGQGRPVLGVVLVPVTGIAYSGAPSGAFRFEGDRAIPIRARRQPEDGADVMVSRSHPDPETADWLKTVSVRRCLEAGSSLKFCRIAEGAADLYPRFALIREWDTAAGQAVLEAAGGSVRDWQGRPLRYGKPDFRNPGYLAKGLD